MAVRSLVARPARLRLRAWRGQLAGHGAVPSPPPRPVGIKLELTWRCNLRCGFCYTDSPRHTLARTPDLPDAAWLGIVDEAIGLGVVEAVVTGGEPLLRPELALAAIERLGAAGVGVALNTNGWFVDEALADRLATAPGLRVFLSIDGAAPALHDGARGVPGSWRRAVCAAHLLLERGVNVQAVHVATPDNVAHLPAFLARMGELGVRGVAVAPVQPVGAAGRSGRWAVDRAAVERAVADFARTQTGMNVRVRGDVGDSLWSYTSRVPRALLVRPNGQVRIESANPFVFGDARGDGLAECWGRIRERWNDPAVTGWARASRGRGLRRAELVAYRDGDVEVGGARGTGTAPVSDIPPAAVQALPAAARDLTDARAELVRLAASRRYRFGDVRWSADVEGSRLVRVRASGQVMRLNRTAALVMDACAHGTFGDATDRLSARYPREQPERIRADAAGALSRLLDAGVLSPALVPAR